MILSYRRGIPHQSNEELAAGCGYRSASPFFDEIRTFRKISFFAVTDYVTVRFSAFTGLSACEVVLYDHHHHHHLHHHHLLLLLLVCMLRSRQGFSSPVDFLFAALNSCRPAHSRRGGPWSRRLILFTNVLLHESSEKIHFTMQYRIYARTSAEDAANAKRQLGSPRNDLLNPGLGSLGLCSESR